jgi:hypothetical protein
MEDRGRLEHLMGIAQSLRLPNASSSASSQSSGGDPPYALSSQASSRFSSQRENKSHSGGAGPIGGGILRALGFGSDTSQPAKQSAYGTGGLLAGASIMTCGSECCIALPSALSFTSRYPVGGSTDARYVAVRPHCVRAVGLAPLSPLVWAG